ncbi:hypothetical protein ACQ1Q5_00340 [Ornithobacterium rhinotracheale]
MIKLRGHKDVKILSNVSEEPKLLGFPLKLAFFHIGSIAGSFFLLMILRTFTDNMFVSIFFPAVLLIGGTTSVHLFYKKWGINGFELSQRDKRLMDNIQSNDSVLEVLREKINKNAKKPIDFI